MRDAEHRGEVVHGACPKCGSTESLATVEVLEGLAPLDISRSWNSEGTVVVETEHSGSTDVLWDSSSSVGLCCRACLWEVRCDDYLDHLVWVDKAGAEASESVEERS